MSEIRQSSSPAVLETPWTEYVEVVLRRRWFVLGGTLAAWALTVPLAFLVPPRFDCVATVALTGLPTPTPPFGEDLVNSASAAAAAPEAIPPEAAATMARDRLAAGISPALYGRLEKTFADASVLRSALGGRFSPGAVQALLSHSPLSPVRNVPVSTLAAAPPAPPLIPAVQVSYSADSAQKAIRGVTALASLVREALVTLTLLDQIEVATFEANSFVVRAHRERLRLAAENESLSLEGAELARLARELPGGRSFTRATADAWDANQGRPSPQTRLIAVKAKRAANDRRAHQLAWASQIATLHTAYLHRLLEALRQEFDRRGCSLSADPEKTIRQTLDEYVRGGDDASESAVYLQSDAEAMVVGLAAVRAGSRLIQSPTLGPQPRGGLVLVSALMLATLTLFVGAALVWESWDRHRARRSLPHGQEAAAP
jgi:hypothetical protein